MLMFESRETLPSLRHHRMLWTGTGATVPTLTFGHGVTLSRTAIGRIKIVWAENPGTFVGLGAMSFRDPTSANINGFTAQGGAYPLTASTFDFEIDFFDESNAAVDLPATSFFDVDIIFSELKSP